MPVLWSQAEGAPGFMPCRLPEPENTGWGGEKTKVVTRMHRWICSMNCGGSWRPCYNLHLSGWDKDGCKGGENLDNSQT